jgi:hypothetical protein
MPVSRYGGIAAVLSRRWASVARAANSPATSELLKMGAHRRRVPAPPARCRRQQALAQRVE